MNDLLPYPKATTREIHARVYSDISRVAAEYSFEYGGGLVLLQYQKLILYSMDLVERGKLC